MLHVCFLDLCSLACCWSSPFVCYAGLPPSHVPCLLKEQLCLGLLYAPPATARGAWAWGQELCGQQAALVRTCYFSILRFWAAGWPAPSALAGEVESRLPQGFSAVLGDSGLFISFSIYRAMIHYISEEKGSIFPSFAIII